jgi:hypothetical protein
MPQPRPAHEVLAARFEMTKGEVLLVACEGRWQRIAAEQFVRASRSAVRQTVRSLDHA